MLTDLAGIGEKTLQNLQRLGIFNEFDLINFIPKAYIDLSKAEPIEEAFEGSFCLVDIIITEKKPIIKKGKLQIFVAYGKSGNIPIKLVWYNQPYISKQFEHGEIVTVYGKVKEGEFCKEIINPKFELKCDKSQFCGIQPLYRTKGLIQQKKMSVFTAELLKNYSVKSIIPVEIEEINHLTSINEAYANLHMPTDLGLISIAKERILIEKLVRRIAGFRLVNKQSNALVNKRFLQNFDISELDKFLPFTLTNSQAKCVAEGTNKLKCGQLFNTVLCGDVGSGKTMVAICLAYYVIKSGYQVALMAPTEILARQHYNLIEKLFSPLGIRVEYLSGSTKNSDKLSILDRLKNGEINFLIGTHSVISPAVAYKDLAFVIADEQHRFGVAQRTELISKGERVNTLTLSATPIPRSMQLVAYGDIDFVTIERRFAQNVKTSIVPSIKRRDMFRYLAKEVGGGKQAFIVAPMIEDEEGIERESVSEITAELQGYVPLAQIGVLHGKLNGEEKLEVLNRFRNKEIGVLVSTTVVEVGIDVPNASIMIVMNADCFGLATLHQLRGRVGRDGSTAYCFLYSEKVNDNLKVLVNNVDGFAIAEEDFRIRGSGDILGLEQSGRGSLEGITLKALKIAKKVAGSLELESLIDELASEIAEFCLDKVSLT